jgi:hypothetical protein
MDCKKYDAQFPNCVNEQSSVSQHSPGVVQNDEELTRMIFSPIHIDKDTGQLTQLAFLDAVDKGLSVNRTLHTSLKELEQKASLIIANAQQRGRARHLVGLAKTKCENIRAIITNDSKQAFCVYDTATSQDQSHADICQAVVGKSQGNEVREELRKLFSVDHLI